MTAGTVFLEPFGGLGNRLRTIVSGVKLADELNKNLNIIWDVGTDFNCPYEKLFNSNSAFTVARKSRQAYSSYNPSFFKQKAINVWNSICGYDLVICEQDHQKTLFKPGFKASDLKAYKNIYVRSCEQFYGGDAWHLFDPVPDLRAAIDAATARFSENTIGIHIRRADNNKSIRYSPLNSFKVLIESELRRDSSTRLFLATDDEQSKQELLHLFGDKTIYLEKEFSRAKEEGIRDAVVDLFVLANCRKIIGSYWSSFTDVAGMMKNAPVVIASAGELPL